MAGPEAQIERHLSSEVVRIGGLSVKLLPATAGVPDRLVVLNGKIWLIELKAPGGRLRQIQKAWHRKCIKRGVAPVVLSSKSEVDEWIKEQQR